MIISCVCVFYRVSIGKEIQNRIFFISLFFLPNYIVFRTSFDEGGFFFWFLFFCFHACCCSVYAVDSNMIDGRGFGVLSLA